MAAAVWLAATSTLAWAQETAPSAEQQPATTGEIQPAADAAEGQQGPVVLRPVSVSATRNPIEAFEYPGMVTVIDPNRPDLRNASTPDDLLNRVPNVEFTGGPRRTGEDPSIRGFSGPDVVIMIDGARQNIDTGHEGRFYLDPSLIGEVEVLRGSASALYGSGGSGGVLLVPDPGCRRSARRRPRPSVSASAAATRASMTSRWAASRSTASRARASTCWAA